jgi:hypothetical protein
MAMLRPLIDTTLNEYDQDGRQTRFAISPFGNSETREERLTRWQEIGSYDPECPMCATIPAHPTLDPFQPSHAPNPRCRSGRRPHCTCDACF